MVKITLFCKQARNMVLTQVLLFLLTGLKRLRLFPPIRTPAMPAVIMVKTRQVLNWPSKIHCLPYSLFEPEGILFKIFLHPSIQKKKKKKKKGKKKGHNLLPSCLPGGILQDGSR